MSWRDTDHNEKMVKNLIGLSFLASADQFVMMSMAQVLVIPLARGIFEGEVANRMYSPSAYYLASTAAGLVVFFLYPMFTAVISFWWFGLDNPNWLGMLDWMMVLAILAFLGSLWGFTFGTFFRNEMNALNWNFMMIFIFNMGAGCTVNIAEDGANFFLRLISTISPVRYGTEMLLRRVLQGKAFAKPVMIQLGYTMGDTNCYIAAAIISIVFFSVGWFNLLRTNNHD